MVVGQQYIYDNWQIQLIKKSYKSYSLHLYKRQYMPQRKAWTEQEDKVIRQLFEIKKITKWSTIAQKMADQYHMPGRNGKQCRQRYQTALEPSFVHQEWTLEQEKIMYKLHDEIGNKWAQIAQKMPGRTDNCVKNHFYSNLRKSIRKLNKCIAQSFKPTIKQIRPIVLYKIIEATDAYFKYSEDVRLKLPFDCGKIKNKLLLLADDHFNIQGELDFVKELAFLIHNFSKDYKRKPKKDRRGVAQSMNLKGPPKIQKDKFKFDDDLDDYDPDQRPASQGQQNDRMLGELESQDSQIYGQKQRDEDSFKQTPGSHKRMSVIQVSGNHSLHLSRHQETQSKGIQMRLQSAGILNNSSLQLPSQPALLNPQASLNNSLSNSYHLIPIQFPFFNSNTTASIYIPFFKQSVEMEMSMENSMNSEYKERQCYQEREKGREKDRVGFNLGESVDKLKCSFLMRHSAEIDEESKLFKSN